MPDDRPAADRSADRSADAPDPAPAEKPPVSTYDVIGEALRLQAERRKASDPPREMPETPTLPRQPKPYKNRNRRRK